MCGTTLRVRDRETLDLGNRLDLGLNLKGVAPKGRLEAAGSWNAMCTHRIKLATAADIDAEVKAWLKQAYDAA